MKKLSILFIVLISMLSCKKDKVEPAASIVKKIELSFSSSSSFVNGYLTGYAVSYLENKSDQDVLLTKFEVWNSTPYMLLYQTVDVNLLGVLKAGEITQIGIYMENVYKPIFKWYFKYDGNIYVTERPEGK